MGGARGRGGRRGAVVDVVEVVDVVDVVDVVLVVDVDVDVVVVVVGGGQSWIFERIPSSSFHGFGPTRTSAWMTPQKGGNGTVRRAGCPDTIPTIGFPVTIGSLTNRTHWQEGLTIGQTVGIVTTTAEVMASNLGIA